MIEILFENLSPDQEISTRANKAAAKALEILQMEETRLSVVFTNNDEIMRLNREFRAIDTPTDVLSFPAEMQDPDEEQIYLGDVIISVEYARKTADTSGHPLLQEIELLVVHGILHLGGYDHVEHADKLQMWELQEYILRQLNNPLRPA